MFGIDGPRGSLASYCIKFLCESGYKVREVNDPSDLSGVSCFVQSAAKHPHHGVVEVVSSNVTRLSVYVRRLADTNIEERPQVIFISSNTADKVINQVEMGQQEIIYGLTKIFGENALAEVSNRLTIFRLTGIVGPRDGRCFFNKLLWAIYLGRNVSIFEPGTPFSEFCARRSVAMNLLHSYSEKSNFALRGGYAHGDLLLSDLVFEAKKLFGSPSRIKVASTSKTSLALPRTGQYEKGCEFLSHSQSEMLGFAVADMGIERHF